VQTVVTAAGSRDGAEDRSGGRLARAVRGHGRGLESLLALIACFGASFAISARLLQAKVISDDALVHQYWMWNFRDPELFTDPLTHALRESQRYPEGYVNLFRLAVEFTSPITFGEFLGIALMAFSAWLVFLITREQTDWRLGPWIAAAVFLSLINIHRFNGGFPRAFVHPCVLLTVLLAMRGRLLLSALVAGAGTLFYPPAALLAVGVLLWCAIDWHGWRPAISRRRAPWALLALAIAAAGVFLPDLLGRAAPAVFTEAEARRFPEFSEFGPLHFFNPSLLDYLRQNRSGFDLKGVGSVLVLAGIALLLVRPANLRLLRREVLALPVVSLGAFTVAQLVLFRLYLPHRYTYPLMAFFAIAIGVWLRPTWTALWERRPRLVLAVAMLVAPFAVYGLANFWFPLGPDFRTRRLFTDTNLIIAGVGLGVAVLLVVAFRHMRAARVTFVGATLTGLLLLGMLLGVPDREARGSVCASSPTSRFLGTLPKDAIIAGDPWDLKCLVGTSRRAVVISSQLSPAYEIDYFHMGRERMFSTLRAYYGQSLPGLVELADRYGATHLWVRREAIRRELAKPERYLERQVPYGRYVRDLLRAGPPVTLRLPADCRVFGHGASEVYDMACLRRQAG
jgi:hypothetical protein